MRTSEAARADRLTAVVLFAVGVAMLWGGVEMDRLEVRRIHPASIPGLVPMLLGGVLTLCALVLFATAHRAPGDAAAAPGEDAVTAPGDGEAAASSGGAARVAEDGGAARMLKDGGAARAPDGRAAGMPEDSEAVEEPDGGAATVLEGGEAAVPGEERPALAASQAERVSTARLAVAALWSSCYALLLVGRVPFAFATTLYIALFVLWFGWPAAEGGAARTRLLAKAAGIGVVAALAIATLFSKGFLVRLP